MTIGSLRKNYSKNSVFSQMNTVYYLPFIIIALLVVVSFIYGRRYVNDKRKAAPPVDKNTNEMSKVDDEKHPHDIPADFSSNSQDPFASGCRMLNTTDIIRYRLKEDEHIPILLLGYSDLPFREMVNRRQKDKAQYFQSGMSVFSDLGDPDRHVIQEMSELAAQHYAIGVRECLQYLLKDLSRTRPKNLKAFLRSLDDVGVVVEVPDGLSSFIHDYVKKYVDNKGK